MLKSKHPYYGKFCKQRNDAGCRGIEWQFDFDTWLEWWGDDIKDRGVGKLCMARFKDQGPYHPDNVYKATWSQNAKDNWDNNAEYRDTIMNIIKTKICKQIQTPHGIFPSMTDAAKYYNIKPASMQTRMKYHPEKYYYI